LLGNVEGLLLGTGKLLWAAIHRSDTLRELCLKRSGPSTMLQPRLPILVLLQALENTVHALVLIALLTALQS